MANTYSTEAQLLQNQPRQMPNAAYAGGRVRRYRNTIPLTAQAATDTITLQPIPAGHVFAFGILNATATLGATATIAIGVAGATGKFRAAAVFTAAAPTLFGVIGAMDDDPVSDNPGGFTPIITVAEAALPGSGTLTVDIYTSAA